MIMNFNTYWYLYEVSSVQQIVLDKTPWELRAMSFKYEFLFFTYAPYKPPIDKINLTTFKYIGNFKVKA